MGKGKDSGKKPSQWSVVTPISIMHRKAHISQGFKQGLQIGCEGSQMTSRPQFPPCGIERLWLTLWGWHLPLKPCWRWILIPLKCTFPLISAYNFGEFGDFQLQSKVPGFKKNRWIGQWLFSYKSENFTNNNDPLCTLTLCGFTKRF